MSKQIKSLLRLIKTGALRVPSRARWSFIDQIFISGVNVLTTILLVRALGLHEFGIYSMLMIGLQFLSTIQAAVVLAPMMSMFDQRGNISQSSYLSAVLLHQLSISAIGIGLLAIASFSPSVVESVAPIHLGLAATLSVSMQFQDLARRFFYVTERPARAFLSDLIAYGARLLVVAVLAFAGGLTIDRVWIAIIGSSAAALLLMVPDLAKLSFSWSAIKEVTKNHKLIAGWMLGSSVVGWLSESSFVFLVIGAVLGPVQLGGARAVQSVIHVVNLLLQALENFVPSTAAKVLLGGGAKSLLRYVTRISLLGAAGIAITTVFLILFADSIMLLIYERTFPDQVAILAVLGAYYALGHVTTVVFAGLRAVGYMQAAFWAQVVVGAGSAAVAWYVTKHWGVVGALLALLTARLLLTGQLALLLRRNAGAKHATLPAASTVP
jgi:O-antigen/teichoic acid export membrane protein